MKQYLFRSWNDLAQVRKKMNDDKDTEDIAVVFDTQSVSTLNVQALADELNYIRNKNGYSISEYGFTDTNRNTFGYLYKLEG